MTEITKARVEAYLAFLRMYKKWESSAYPFDKEFLEQVIYMRAPLDYIDTHYTLYKEINTHKLPPPAIVVFDTDQTFETSLEEKEIPTTGEEKSTPGSFPAPITFVGDVHVKGNLEIAFDNRVYILGDLIVDRVLWCKPYSVLMVAGTIKAKAIQVSASNKILSMCAEKIEVAELLHIENFIYTGEIRSKLILAEASKLAIPYSGYGHIPKCSVPVISSSTIFGLPMADSNSVRSLCNPKIFRSPESETDLADLIYDLFDCLEYGTTFFTEDDLIIIDSIFI